MLKKIPHQKFKTKYFASVVKIFVLATFIFVVGFVCKAEAATITFVNHSGFEIKGVYITNNNDSWGVNRLNDTLKNGYSRTVHYDYYKGRYAIAVVFMNGNWWRWGGEKSQDLNNASKMTIYYEKNSDNSDGFRLYSD